MGRKVGLKLWMEIMERSKTQEFEYMVAMLISPWSQRTAMKLGFSLLGHSEQYLDMTDNGMPLFANLNQKIKPGQRAELYAIELKKWSCEECMDRLGFVQEKTPNKRTKW